MNKFIIGLLLILLTSTTMAYTPKLLLISQDDGFKRYLDEKSIQRIDESLMKVIIYDKYNSKINDDYAENYQSAIKVYILDCPYKAIAMGQASYYNGITSNSNLVKTYNNIKGIDGDTGEIYYFYHDIEFTPIRNSLSDQKIYKRVCVGK